MMFRIFRQLPFINITNSFVRKVRGASILFLFLIILSNCIQEQVPDDAQISLIRQHLCLKSSPVLFGYNTNLTDTLVVEGENTPWQLTGIPDWLNASVTKGEGAAIIVLAAKENASVDIGRAAILTFTSTTPDYQYSKAVSISQPVADVYIVPSEESISSLPSGDKKTITISSNVEWEAICSDSWITLSKVDNGQLRINVSENLGETRVSTIHLRRSDTSNIIKTITVTQAEAGVSGSAENIAFAVDGEMKTTTIIAEASWNIHVSDNSWIKVSPLEGNVGTSTISIIADANVSANARNGFVYVSIGKTTKLAIPVSQDGVNFVTDSTALNIKSTTEATSINVTANAKWSVISKPDWLDVKPTNGESGVTKLTLQPQENPNTTNRSGQLVIGRDGFSGNQIVTIIQEGKSFGTIASEMDFPVMSSTQTLTVDTDGKWTASSSDTWIHLNPIEGAGQSTLTISVDANPRKEERVGSVTITVGKTSQTIAIVQAGRELALNCDNVITNSNPAVINLSISANGNWTASTDVEWMTLEPKQGEGNAQLTISVADNPSIHERKGTVIVKSGEETQSVLFSQPGRTLSLNISTDTPLTFSATGGTSNTITVATDGKYTVSSSDESWLTVKEKNNTFSIQASPLNSVSEREGSVKVSLTDLTSDEKLERIITVKQAGNILEVSKSSIFFPALGGTSEFIIVTTDGSYQVTASADWLSVNESVNGFTITASQIKSINKRSGTVTVALTNLLGEEKLERTISVEQNPLTLDVNPSSLSFTYDGSMSQTITVNTDGTYSASCSASWLSVSKNGNTITVKATENEKVTKRTAIITVALTGLNSGESLKKQISVSQDAYKDPLGLCPDKNHPHLIDLGLSVKWACCNVGASSPVEYGGFYAWGETETKESYTKDNYKWYNGWEITKYGGRNDGNSWTYVLESSDDAAYVNWGNKYRTPTNQEFVELCENCSWSRTTLNGINGCKVIGGNGNCIFLPAAGVFYDKTDYSSISILSQQGDLGSYWTSLHYYVDKAMDVYFYIPQDYMNVFDLYYNGDFKSTNNCKSRYAGRSVRPIGN